MRIDLRGFAPLLGVSTFVATITTWYALGIYLPSFNSTQTDITGVEHPASPLTPTPGLARRLVVVVVDGMKYDVARTLPELAGLRREGVLRELESEPPTYTGPEITAMMPGLSPRDSGVRLNGPHQGVPGIDALPLELAAGHVPMEIDDEGFQPFGGLVRVPKGTKLVSGRVHFVADLIERRLGLVAPLAPIDLKTPAREVAFVHIEDVDEEGHLHGAASPEYAEAAHRAGRLVQRIAATLDLNQDALVALSDHGHLDAGGHGGVEPEVQRAFLLAAGGVFRRGVELEPRPMSDVAPTLAVVAGVRAPTSSLARPMIDMMSVDDAIGAVLLAGPFDQAAHFLCAIAPSPRCKDADALVLRLAQHDTTALPEADAVFAELTATRARAIVTRAEPAARLRTILAAVFSIGCVAAFVLFARRAGRRALGVGGVVAPFVYAAVYAAYLATRGYRPTFSAMKSGVAFARGSTPAALLAAICATVLVLFLRPGRFAPWFMLLAICAPYVVLVAVAGIDPASVPAPVAGMLVLVLGPGVVGAAVAAAAIAVVVAARSEALSTSGENG